MCRIGFLITSSPTTGAYEAFRAGIKDCGLVEGNDVVIEARFAGGPPVDVIFHVGAVAVRAAQGATSSIPIVFAVAINPVVDGLISAKQTPGGHLTGVTSCDPDQPAARIELLKRTIPMLAKLATIHEHGLTDTLVSANVKAAEALGLKVHTHVVAGPEPDFRTMFSEIETQNSQALLVLELPITILHRKRIGELAIEHKIPAMFARDNEDAAGLFFHMGRAFSRQYGRRRCR